MHGIVIDAIEFVATQKGAVFSRSEVSSDSLVANLGIDSLGLAILVAYIDSRLGIDPFSSGASVAFPRTVGDLVELYSAYSIKISS